MSDRAEAGAVRSSLMQTYSPAPVTFVRGLGTELWDDRGRRYLDFVAGLAVVSLGHAHPRGGRCRCRAGPPPVARLQSLPKRAGAGGGGHPRPADRRGSRAGGRPDLLRQLRGGGQRMCPQAGPALGRQGSPRRGLGLGLVPRAHLGHPDGDGPARQACALPAAASGLCAHSLRRSPCPGGHPSRCPGSNDGEGVAGVLLEPLQGEGGVIPRRRTICEGCASSATSTTRC